MGISLVRRLRRLHPDTSGNAMKRLLKTLLTNLLADARGNALFLSAAASFALVGAAGLGVDAVQW